MEHLQNLFGLYDGHIQRIEHDFHVEIVNRDGQLKILGEEPELGRAWQVMLQLIELSKRGNVIQEQNVDYAIAMGMEDEAEVLVEIDKDCICHTVNGKPVKPKTMGQKKYVDAIRNHTIVFGLGPAGTGKTYLAMAMAITAFKNNEVSRINLTL